MLYIENIGDLVGRLPRVYRCAPTNDGEMTVLLMSMPII